ncbi:MAG: hypothetical protein SF097_09135 [Acidobacteriota bacterium]|nr:hypothetical protein [Acidobacteriota bacterium]
MTSGDHCGAVTSGQPNDVRYVKELHPQFKGRGSSRYKRDAQR